MRVITDFHFAFDRVSDILFCQDVETVCNGYVFLFL